MKITVKKWTNVLFSREQRDGAKTFEEVIGCEKINCDLRKLVTETIENGRKQDNTEMAHKCT